MQSCARMHARSRVWHASPCHALAGRSKGRRMHASRVRWLQHTVSGPASEARGAQLAFSKTIFGPWALLLAISASAASYCASCMSASTLQANASASFALIPSTAACSERSISGEG
eukprot:58026-Chlamydomonas_euryale.AAC.13